MVSDAEMHRAYGAQHCRIFGLLNDKLQHQERWSWTADAAFE